MFCLLYCIRRSKIAGLLPNAKYPLWEKVLRIFAWEKSFQRHKILFVYDQTRKGEGKEREPRMDWFSKKKKTS